MLKDFICSLYMIQANNYIIGIGEYYLPGHYTVNNVMQIRLSL